MRRHPSSTTTATPPNSAAVSAAAPPKKRGSYNCGRCGVPKKGHVCTSAADPPRSDNHRLRRALSFDDCTVGHEEEVDFQPLAIEAPPVVEEDEEVEVAGGFLPLSCLVEVLRRLPPRELMAAAGVSKGWRECVRRVWRSAEELRLRVPPRSQIGLVGSVLPKCAGLIRLSLRMESDVDATVLACVAFSCPCLETFEISTSAAAVNRISGDELGRFVAERRSLSTLKIEGCINLGFLNLCSSSLSTIWLSDLYCVSKTVINCPNLKELSLDFARQENDSTDLTTIIHSLGRTCPQLTNIHIASIRLCNEVVLALEGANLRALRMLSLVLGSKITDAAVAAIVSSCTNLELLDLSGSSISDSGIGMICNGFPDTLSSLLLALCPNITSSGIQCAATQLPLLQIIDCGMSMRDLISQDESLETNGVGTSRSDELNCCQKLSTRKLIIKHDRLKKLSLWGCSGLDALYLNCPDLNDLNLNSCTNLHPERFLLQCPNLEKVHASGCQNMLIGAIKNQIFNEFSAERHLPCKRLADGSKRVQVPHFLAQQPSEDEKLKRSPRARCILQID